MNINDSWKVNIFTHSATHSNGTVVSYENGFVSNIEHLPSSISVHEISAFIKTSEIAYKESQYNRPRKPILSLKTHKAVDER